MNRDQRRAYRVLGVPPGSPRDAVKQAYRDLAQVWHPDRFQHNDRLNEKAQRNLKRVNQAYALLKDHEPTEPLRASRLSVTMSAVMDLGDILQSRDIHRAPAAGERRMHRNRDVVLGVGDFRSTAELRRRKPRTRWKPAALIGVALLLVVLSYFFL